jgi:hypothetical protein
VQWFYNHLRLFCFGKICKVPEVKFLLHGQNKCDKVTGMVVQLQHVLTYSGNPITMQDSYSDMTK